MTLLAVYGGMFLSALSSATLLPGQSEAVLVALLAAGHSPVALLVTATVGNVLGSLVNWGLGRGIERFRDRDWFPVSPSRLARAQAWYVRYGRWSLLLSWLPVVGDALTVVAGAMRETALVFLLLVTLAKAARYGVLAAVTLHLV